MPLGCAHDAWTTTSLRMLLLLIHFSAENESDPIIEDLNRGGFSCNFVYGDVREQNILVSNTRAFLLVDFYWWGGVDGQDRSTAMPYPPLLNHIADVQWAESMGALCPSSKRTRA